MCRAVPPNFVFEFTAFSFAQFPERPLHKNGDKDAITLDWRYVLSRLHVRLVTVKECSMVHDIKQTQGVQM